MSKLKDLASVKTANAKSFAYTPPNAAYGALRTLIKIDANNVSLAILGAVLRGLRRVNPQGRIVIVDRFESRESFAESGIMDFMDDEMRATTIENLLMENYRNLSPQPERYLMLTAPGYFGEYECVLSISGLTETGASLANLANAFIEGRIKVGDESERVEVTDVVELCDVYFSVGHLVHGVIVDLGERVNKVIWGDNMLAVDESAYLLAGEPLPEVINTIRQLKKQIADQ